MANFLSRVQARWATSDLSRKDREYGYTLIYHISLVFLIVLKSFLWRASCRIHLSAPGIVDEMVSHLSTYNPFKNGVLRLSWSELRYSDIKCEAVLQDDVITSCFYVSVTGKRVIIAIDVQKQSVIAVCVICGLNTCSEIVARNTHLMAGLQDWASPWRKNDSSVMQAESIVLHFSVTNVEN